MLVKRDHTRVGDKNFFLPVLFILISALMLTFSTRSFANISSFFGLTVLGYVQQGFSAISSFVTSQFTSLSELKTLKEKNLELSNTLQTYTNITRTLSELKSENERLRMQLQFSSNIRYEHLPARIIGRDTSNLYSSMILDKGTKDGIAKDMPVIAYQDNIEGLVGKVLEAGLSSSRIRPIYDQKLFVAARLSSGLRYEGLVNGQGTLAKPLLMTNISKQAEKGIQIGDIIITSGYESIYPSNIAIGRVKKTYNENYLPSLHLDLDPIIDISRLEYVFIIKKNETESISANGVGVGNK